ncbi:MAG: hypothetical protein ACR2JV_00685 [Gaiellales bacterium]
MRRILLGMALLLAVAPAASAKSFEMPDGSGDGIFRASAGGEASLMVGYIGATTRITGPADLDGLSCVSKKPLDQCATLRHTAKGVEWRVLQPVKLFHQATGPFRIVLRGAKQVHDVFYSGSGTVRLKGFGNYTADGASSDTYTPQDGVVIQSLK